MSLFELTGCPEAHYEGTVILTPEGRYITSGGEEILRDIKRCPELKDVILERLKGGNIEIREHLFLATSRTGSYRGKPCELYRCYHCGVYLAK